MLLAKPILVLECGSGEAVIRMNLNAILRTKRGAIAATMFSLAFSAWCVYGFVGMVRQAHTRFVMQDFADAVTRLEQSPPGIARAETFLGRLRTIKTGYAPREVKQALNDYIVALQNSIQALKSGQDTKPYDAALAQAKQKLIRSCRKYNCL
jgi:hypothetical protein